MKRACAISGQFTGFKGNCYALDELLPIVSMPQTAAELLG